MKTDDLREAESALLDAIRVETALSRFPMHRLAKQGTVPIEIRETGTHGELALRWEISHNSKYGQPGPLAYKLDTLIVNRRVERAGRPTPRVLRLGSLKEIARDLDLGGDTQKVKAALRQNAGAFISAKIRYKSADGTERRLEVDGTRYVVVFTGERLPDGREADAVYLVLNDFYREVLDQALRRPLDFDYLCELPPIAQRWYELASYRIFAALKHHWPKVWLSYAEFCLYAPQTRYTRFGLMRRQMAKIHTLHQQSGYITGVEFEATTDSAGRPDWAMIYVPGPKAKAEFKAFTAGKGGPVAPQAELPLTKTAPAPEPTGLEAELIERGVSSSEAAVMMREFSEDRIRAQIERLDWLREKRPKKIADPGAYLADAIRRDFAPPAGFDTEAKRAERQAAAQAQDDEIRRARAREREERARIDAFWYGLSEEQRAKLEADALEQADPEVRAQCTSGPLPVRRMTLAAVREAHIRALLHPPVSG